MRLKIGWHSMALLPMLLGAVQVQAQELEQAPETETVEETGSSETIEQAITPPPMDSVEVPAITEGRDRRVVRNGWKYFYFYRADTSYEDAYADLAECYRFLPVPNRNVELPAFAPWDANPDATIFVPQSPYGLVGDLIGSMVAGPIERRMSQSRMRRCMEPRGYARYPMSKDNWEIVIDNYSQQSIAMQAKLVALGQPDAEPLPVTR